MNWKVAEFSGEKQKFLKSFKAPSTRTPSSAPSRGCGCFKEPYLNFWYDLTFREITPKTYVKTGIEIFSYQFK
jgi:hypothetical protein